tara:strand:- start:28 stop:591 length:564 start_codon:yes stop_codon:yes gene_type:complete
MAQKTEFLEVDLFNMKPIPGSSLTEEPGKRPYERPPQITRVDEALDYSLQSLFSDRDTKEKVIDALDLGISAETIASAFTLQAFTEGVFTPDVAELIKQPLIQFIVQEGDGAGITDMNVTNENVPKEQTEEKKLSIMRNLHPDKYAQLLSEEEDEEIMYEEDMNEEDILPMDQGFINREEARDMQDG